MGGVNRREIVLLVSRAIAVLQFIDALLATVFSLPTVILLSFRALTLRAQVPDSFRQRLDLMQEAQMPLLLAKIAVQFFLAWLFWNCGPFIERLLAPSGEDSS